MTIYDLLRQNKKKIQILRFNSAGPIPQISPDSTLSLSHSMKNTVTSYPIESGLQLIDNIFRENKKITLNGVITDNPIDLQQSILTSAVTAFTSFLPNIVSASLASLTNNSQNRTLDAFLILEQIFDNGEIISLQTGFKLYQNLVITDLSIDENVRDELNFTITLEQINFAQSEDVVLLKVDSDVEHTATGKTEEGKKNKNALNSEQEKKMKKKSIAASIYDGLFKK